MPGNIGLWGDLPTAGAGRSPKQILGEQAAALDTAMQGKLYGKVGVDRDESVITVDLSIVAPYIHNYEVGIVRVRHGVLMYPLRLENLVRSEAWTTCNDEQEFRTALTRVLQGEETKKVISSLLIQSED